MYSSFDEAGREPSRLRCHDSKPRQLSFNPEEPLMTTEKFLCKKCTCVCFLSISFTPGDEKTKSSLVCPLQFINYDFEICDKAPERAEIKAQPLFSTRQQIEHLKKRNDQLTYLKKLMKDCSKCSHAADDDYCFKFCRGFSEYSDGTIKIKPIGKGHSIYERGNA